MFDHSIARGFGDTLQRLHVNDAYQGAAQRVITQAWTRVVTGQ